MEIDATTGKMGFKGEMVSTRKEETIRTVNENLRKPALRRIARRAGIKRISGNYYDVIRKIAVKKIAIILHDAMTFMEYANRKTVTPDDIVRSSKRRGMILYGYGWKGIL